MLLKFLHCENKIGLLGFLIGLLCTSSCLLQNKTSEKFAVWAYPNSGISHKIDPEFSRVYWKGTSGSYEQSGYFPIVKGWINYQGKSFTKGQFLVSCAEMEIDGAENHKILKHLKSSDFLKVNHFPAANFSIHHVEELSPPYQEVKGIKISHKIEGYLDMLGHKQMIQIPIYVYEEKSRIFIASPPFSINRTDWGINFGSPTVPNTSKEIIDDLVEMKVEFVLDQ